MTEGLSMTERLTGPERLNRRPNGADDLAGEAAALDAADPLADFRDEFIGADDPKIIAYLDGNSLGRPLRATRERISHFVTEIWGRRLIRAWDEGWMDDPLRIGDQLGRLVLGAAPGQTVVGDSTSVMLYKWIRAALASQAGRDEIIVDVGNFPTDRFVVEGIATELEMRVIWLRADRRSGVIVDQVTEATGSRTALIVLSDVAYRSGYLSDVAAITAMGHDHGALVLWDLCHSAGVIPRRLDAWRVDLAVGCTYKYLNGGPGSPAFGYVRADLHNRLRQPIQGWMGAAEPFAMAEHYTPSDGIRRFLSGTPSIMAMLGIQDMLALIEQAGLEAIRAKSVALTEFAIEVSDRLLGPLGVAVGSPRDHAVRGSHVTLEHPEFRVATQRLWEMGVIPDFRPPDGLRIGLSPLSTSFGEVYRGLLAVQEVLWQQAR
jgi:kynureninase